MRFFFPRKEVRCSLWSHINTHMGWNSALLARVGLTLRIFLPLKLSQHLEDTWWMVIKLATPCPHIRKRRKSKDHSPRIFPRLLDNLSNLRKIFFFHFNFNQRITCLKEIMIPCHIPSYTKSCSPGATTIIHIHMCFFWWLIRFRHSLTEFLTQWTRIFLSSAFLILTGKSLVLTSLLQWFSNISCIRITWSGVS